jgi:predicted Fe-Mo cluster-binding NifX family protein
MKWLVGLLIVCSSLFSDVIAVASDGDNLHSNISSKASRCNYYILIDKNGNILEKLQNSNKDIKGGASSKLINMLNRKKVSHLIASSFGEKLIRSLDANNIKYTIHKGDINTFIEQIIKK